MQEISDVLAAVKNEAPAEYTKDHQKCEPEMPHFSEYKGAYTRFHDLGLYAVHDFIEEDRETYTSHLETLKRFIARHEGLTQTKFFQKRLHGFLCNHLEKLPTLYADSFFNYFVEFIIKNYNQLITTALYKEDKDQCALWLQEVNNRISNIQKKRIHKKEERLEQKILSLLNYYFDDLTESLHDTQSAEIYKHVSQLRTSFDQARVSFKNNLIKDKAHSIYAKLCFNYSYWAWIHDEHEHALEFGKEAHTMIACRPLVDPHEHNPYEYWVALLTGKKTRERRIQQNNFNRKKKPRPRTPRLPSDEYKKNVSKRCKMMIMPDA